MPLITCPACGKSVSSEAPACPGCGHPILRPPPVPRKTGSGLGWGLGCLLAIPALMIVVAIIGLLAAIAVPSFIKARTMSQLNACANTLRQLEEAKDEAAASLNLREGDAVPESEIWVHLPTGAGAPRCPLGADYLIHPLGTAVECPEHGTLDDLHTPAPGPAPRPQRRPAKPGPRVKPAPAAAEDRER